MAYLHSQGHLHRDIAARNILLTVRNLQIADAKLGDFGLSQGGGTTYEMHSPDKAIPVTGMAPEVFFFRIFCAQSDVW